MRKTFRTFSLITIIFHSCIISKTERALKKTAKTWQNSPIVLDAYLDTPMSGLFFKLRENGKFEHTSSGVFRSFQAGNWTRSQDTIKLEYQNNNIDSIKHRYVVIDRKTSTLLFEGDSVQVYFRYRIMMNMLK
jgi:hypothetical protein